MLIATGTGFGELTELTTTDIKSFQQFANFQYDSVWKLYIAHPAIKITDQGRAYSRRMSLTPEDEMMISVGVRRRFVADGARRGLQLACPATRESPTVDLICRCERHGWVTLHEGLDPADDRMIMRARLTPAGQRRIGELNRAGVQPSKSVDADADAY